MVYIKGIILLTFATVLLTSFQNINGKICRRKNYTCPNTASNYTLTNPVIISNVERKLIIDILSSNLLPSFSPKAQEVINCVKFLSNTDSQSLLNTLFLFSLFSFGYLIHADETPSLCLAAANINASVEWATTRDGTKAAAALRGIGSSVFYLCQLLESSALLNLGCENVVSATPPTTRCNKRGYIYEVEKNLELFGGNLPCCIYDGIISLYSSNIYVDKLLAATLSIAITPEFGSLVSASDFNLLIEPAVIVLNNNVSVCCCPKRLKRYTELCVYHNISVNQNVETLINNTYLYNECATEPEPTCTSTVTVP